jgi:hypothetical protein
MLHGNTIEFRERLINEIGLIDVETLEHARHDSIKWSRFEYLQMIEDYKAEIKSLT